MTAGVRGLLLLLLLVVVVATVMAESTISTPSANLPAPVSNFNIKDIEGYWLDASYGWSYCETPNIRINKNESGNLVLEYNHQKVPDGISKNSPVNGKPVSEWIGNGKGVFTVNWKRGTDITVLALKPKKYVILHYATRGGRGHIRALRKQNHIGMISLKEKMYELSRRKDLPFDTFLFYPKNLKACNRTTSSYKVKAKDVVKDNLANELYNLQNNLLYSGYGRPLTYQNITYYCRPAKSTYSLLAKFYTFESRSWLGQTWTEEKMITLRSVLQGCGCKYKV